MVDESRLPPKTTTTLFNGESNNNPQRLGRETVVAAIAEIKAGRPVVVTDDADRENEGDLIFAAESATPETIAFVVRHTSGVICVAALGARLDELQLPPMVDKNQDPKGTAFTVSVDLKKGVTTGISAADRARTIRALADPSEGPDSFCRPGHIFPLRARPGGVLERGGHTEAAVDLAVLAGLYPAGGLCEIVRDEDGEMSRGDDLEKFRKAHNLVATTIEDIRAYRRELGDVFEQKDEAPRSVSISRLSQTKIRLPTKHGVFEAVAFIEPGSSLEHIALLKGFELDEAGDVTEIIAAEETAARNGSERETTQAAQEANGSRFESPPLVRVHSECATGDIFGSRRCDCGEQLERSMVEITKQDRGILLYIRGHEGR
ncbi:MAG: 3,4-dihydroxy-2-butanone-4-phosphate synthase, partial [Planctomycetota bacterium]